MIDSHCHLQNNRFFDRVDHLINEAKAHKIVKVVCCGTKESDWPLVDRLFQKYPDFIIPSFGLHPWYIKERSEKWLEKLTQYVSCIPCGVGEIGLDHTIEVDFKLQNEIFTAQLELAKALSRPVSIHCRRAWQDLRVCLQLFAPFSKGGIIHSYSGSVEFISQLVEIGLSVSFSGTITYSGNHRGRKALSSVPLNQFVLETDSPDLAPLGIAVDNEPKNLVQIVKTAGQLLGKTEDEVIKITTENALRIFG